MNYISRISSPCSVCPGSMLPAILLGQKTPATWAGLDTLPRPENIKSHLSRSYLIEPTSCKLLTVGHPLLIPPYVLSLKLQQPVPLVILVLWDVTPPVPCTWGQPGRNMSTTAPANYGNVNEHKYFLK